MVVILTGAAGDIGSATARAFAAEGADLVLSDVREEPLHALAVEVRAPGVRVLSVPADVTDRAQVEVLVARALSEFGRIDVLANVAGIGSRPSISDSTDEELERVVNVNLLAPARLIHAVLPVMRAQRRGWIVNVGSVAGEVGVMGMYTASKFGVRGLTDTLRREVRADGIRVSLIQPGFVRSAMNAAMGDGLPGPEIVADAIVAAVKRPRRRRVVPPSYWFPILLAKWFPWFTDAVFGNARIQRRLNRDARAAHAQHVLDE